MLRRAFIIFFSLGAFLSAPAHAGPPDRIVSLAPSVTEILYALGVGDRVAGVTAFCDYPPEAAEKPAIGGMSNPSLEAVLSLRPDAVIMTTNGNPMEFEARLSAMGISTHVLRERRLEGLPRGMREVGRAVGAGERAERLALDMEETLEGWRRARPFRGRALFIIWPEPLMVAGPGSVIDDALRLLGLTNIASGARAAYPRYSVEEAMRQAPEYIFIGRGHESLVGLSGRLLKRLKNTPAVREGKVFFVSDNLYRFGPRVIKGVEELAERLRGAQDAAPEGR